MKPQIVFALGPQQWNALTPAERDLLKQLQAKATRDAKRAQ